MWQRAGAHLSRGRLCSPGELGGLFLVGGSGGVPLVEPWSAEQAWDPGRTTAMVPCSWLEMRWGFCMGSAGQPGWARLLPSALFSVPLWAGHPPTLSLASTLVT